MFIKMKQLSLFDTFKHLSSNESKPNLIQLMNDYINISDFIPPTLHHAYYQNLGRKRQFSLSSIICALIIKQFLNLEKMSTFLNILHLSSELKHICGFKNNIPSESFFSRFKSDFSDLLKDLFYNLVDITEPICNSIDKKLSDILIYDTSGIEAYVKENNPKYINSKIKSVKNSSKSLSTSDAAAIVYSSLPAKSSANDQVKKMYTNGYFCYAYKFGILTNALGIIRDITFLKDLDDKVYDDPQEQKFNSDTKSLKPILNTFYLKHPSFSHSVFLADAEFDSYSNYSYLLNDLAFSKAIIPLNSRRKTSSPAIEFNEFGHPLCSSDSKTPMKYWGKCPTQSSSRFKFICPKYKREGNSITTTCQNPCTESKYGRVHYIYPEKEIRLYPGSVRNSPEWKKLYTQRTIVEQAISNLKINYGLSKTFSNRKNYIKTDLIIAACSQLLLLILSDNLSISEPIKSIKAFLNCA